MKTNNIYGMTNYYKIFQSPVSSSNAKPVTNFIHSAISSQIYSKTIAKNLQSSVAKYLSTVRDSTDKLKESSKTFLDPGENSSFNRKTIYTDDENSLNAFSNSKAKTKSYTVNISQLAETQENESLKLTSDENTIFNLGKNTFSIDSDKDKLLFTFTIDENDTNKSSLEKFAKTINNTDTNYHAVVENIDNVSYLKLSSNDIEKNTSFTVNNIEGDFISVSGIENISRESKNAKYSIDGIESETSNNNLSLDDDNLKIELKKADSKDIEVTVDIDKEGIKDDIVKLVQNFNSLINFANSSLKNFSGANTIKKELHQIVNPKAISLENIGIYYNNDGTLTIDYDKLESSIEKDINSVKNAFGSYNSIAKSFDKKGSEIISSPFKYSKPASFDENYETYMNYMKLSNNSTSSNNFFKGLMLNTLL